jgi:signal transduction histidine kinase
VLFRHRIGLLVILAAVALLGVTAVTLVLGSRSEQQLAGIETRYVPLIELDRDVKRTFAEVVRALEDAAGAGEEAKLEEADRLSMELTRRLAEHEQAIAENGADPTALAAAYRAYYRMARAVSSALVAGTPAGQISDQIEAMRRARHELEPRLDAATRPDRERLAAAFASARASQDTALQIVGIVAAATFFLMALISYRMIRRMVTSLRELSDGVERLARGDFSREIEVSPGDEIGDLAREANRTATRLREFRDQTQSMLAEVQRQARAAETANKELEAFSYSVSHDLRAPLRAIDGFSQALVEDEADKLSREAREHLDRIRGGAQRMGELIDDLLRLSRVSRGEFHRDTVNVSDLATQVLAELRRRDPARTVELIVQDDASAFADSRLVRILLENLLGNAWKFTGKASAPRIEFGVKTEGGERVFFVRDNGAGFDMKYVNRLFGAFQRLHRENDFPGTGIGLATAQRIVLRHGGRIWVEAEIGRGAAFYFTLPAAA